MRSVVVVLPASMWAMIPMFRVFWRLYLRGMKCLSSSAAASRVALFRAKKRAPRAQVLHTEVGPEMWAMSLGSPCEDAFRPARARRDANLRPAAAYENSIRPVARYAPLVPIVAGALLLIVAEFTTVREIVVVTVVPPDGTDTGGSLHL